MGCNKTTTKPEFTLYNNEHMFNDCVNGIDLGHFQTVESSCSSSVRERYLHVG